MRATLVLIALLGSASKATCSENCAVNSSVLLQTSKAQAQVGAYVPGQPGKVWSQLEMVTIKAKLLRVFQEPDEVCQEVPCTVDEQGNPGLPKFVRLGFHDCMRYTDGTGGCDGCLDFRGMGQRWKDGTKPKDDNQDHNNGLEPAVQVLEKIYTDGSFPTKTAALATSPKDSGISRSDLWAYAAMIAIEVAIGINNDGCTIPDDIRLYKGECHPRLGEPDCLVKAPRAFNFAMGRRDCIPDASLVQPWKTSKHEVSPSAQANGKDTLAWMKKEFGFNGRETVAIMGGHTLGRFHREISSQQYTWKTGSQSMFNNGYYRLLANRLDWYFPSGTFENETDIRSHTCRGVGNSTGNRPLSRWRPTNWGNTPNGGPSQWVQEQFACGCFGIREELPSCCLNAMGDYIFEDVFRCPAGCEQWQFPAGLDETMLNSDMGLYRKFSLEANGILARVGSPSKGDCPGLEASAFSFDSFWDSSQCPLNTIQDPPGDLPMYKIVEAYADNNDEFFKDFFPAYEKMLMNGYQASALSTAPLPNMVCDLIEVVDPSRFYKCSVQA